MSLIPDRLDTAVLRQDAIDLLTSRQWTGGPDHAYHDLRARTALQVDVMVEALRWLLAGESCRCPFGDEQPHRRHAGCAR